MGISINVAADASAKHDPNEVLTPAQVAAIYHVDPKTVARWHGQGRLVAVRTLGGHRRFRRGDLPQPSSARTAC